MPGTAFLAPGRPRPRNPFVVPRVPSVVTRPVRHLGASWTNHSLLPASAPGIAPQSAHCMTRMWTACTAWPSGSRATMPSRRISPRKRSFARSTGSARSVATPHSRPGCTRCASAVARAVHRRRSAVDRIERAGRVLGRKDGRRGTSQAVHPHARTICTRT